MGKTNPKKQVLILLNDISRISGGLVTLKTFQNKQLLLYSSEK